MTPERVETVTSVTCGRSRTFETPVGGFSYRMIPLEAFRTGMDRVEIDAGRSFLIAIPEKALADRIVAERGSGINSQKGLHEFLVNNLRIDPGALRDLDAERLSGIAWHYRSRRVRLLAELAARLGKRGWNPTKILNRELEYAWGCCRKLDAQVAYVRSDTGYLAWMIELIGEKRPEFEFCPGH